MLHLLIPRLVLGLAVTADEVAEVIYGFIDLSKVVTGETYLVDGGYHLTI